MQVTTNTAFGLLGTSLLYSISTFKSLVRRLQGCQREILMAKIVYINMVVYKIVSVF